MLGGKGRKESVGGEEDGKSGGLFRLKSPRRTTGSVSDADAAGRNSSAKSPRSPRAPGGLSSSGPVPNSPRKSDGGASPRPRTQFGRRTAPPESTGSQDLTASGPIPGSPRKADGGASPRRRTQLGRKTAPSEMTGTKMAEAGGHVIRKHGWMRKKMKKRWFLLVDEWLYWFKDAMKLDGDKTNWEDLDLAQGSLFISRCNVTAVDGTKDFVIVNPSGKNYLINANSEEQRDEWVEALQKVAEVQAEHLGLLAQAIEKRGTLKYRQVPKWFVLKEGVLMWFASETDPQLEGSTTLQFATVALGETLDGGPAFVIATMSEKHVIGAETRSEAEEWANYIRASISAAKTKAMEKKKEELESRFVSEPSPHHEGSLGMMGEDARFFFMLEGGVLCWYREYTDFGNLQDIRKNIRGFVGLKRDMQIQALPDLPREDNAWIYGFAITTRSSGRSVAFMASTRDQRDEWLNKLNESLEWQLRQNQQVVNKVRTGEKEGFLLRGKLKIWAVCKDGHFRTYDSKSTKKAVSSIPLESCSAVEARDDGSFLLFTSVPSLEILTCVGRRNQLRPERDEWFQCLLLNVFKTSKNAASAAEKRGSTSSGLSKTSGSSGRASRKSLSRRMSQSRLRRGTVGKENLAFAEQRRNGTVTWVHKNKRIDYFFSIVSTTLIWYTSEQELSQVGSAPLCGCVAKTFGCNVSLFASDEKLIVEFMTADQPAAKSWGLALQEAIQEADEERGYKKFGYLESQGKRRWVALTTRHCIWFPGPMKISEIQNAGAFERVLLRDCDVTAFGECGFVLSERRADDRVGEKVKVVSFQADSPLECQEWMRLLQSLVAPVRASSSLGLPYRAIRLMSKGGGQVKMSLDPMTQLIDKPAVQLLQGPECGELFLPDGRTPIAVLGYLEEASRQVAYRPPAKIAEEGMEDSFAFSVSVEDVESENVARLTLKPIKSTRKPLPQPPSSRNKSGPPLPAPRPPSNVAIEVVFYQRSKRVLRNEVWQEVLENVASIPTREALFAKSDLRALILDTKSKPLVTNALMSCMAATEIDQVVQAIVNLYVVDGCALGLIESHIRGEIEAADREETLFRTNSVATKLCKFYSNIVGASYLKHVLAAPVQAIIGSNLDYEVDPTRVDAAKVERNLENLQNGIAQLLDVIEAEVRSLPTPLTFICGLLWRCVESKFGEHKFAAVGGFLFLRFICPAVLTPDSHGLLEQDSPALSKDERRRLTLVAKCLQNISNGVEFGRKEEYMTPLNDFVREKIPVVSSFFNHVAFAGMQLDASCEEPCTIPAGVEDRSLDNVYKQMLLQRRKLEALGEDQWKPERMQPIFDAIGVPERMKKAVAQQKAIQQGK